MLICAAAAALAAAVAQASTPAASDSDVARRACAAIVARVDDQGGSAPVLLRSYDSTAGSGSIEEPSQKTTAYVYDNALAVIALLSCDRPRQARRIGAALRLAALDGARLRNAYRAGPVTGAPLANGWWDAKGNHWAEDPQQQGTATGNVAWAAIALLDLHAITGEPEWLDSAQRLAAWIVEQTSDQRGAGGFNGGIEGDDTHARKVAWKSTEHNTDVAA
jgi:rhamnogalacturonyl hydrolase YesR